MQTFFKLFYYFFSLKCIQLNVGYSRSRPLQIKHRKFLYWNMNPLHFRSMAYSVQLKRICLARGRFKFDPDTRAGLSNK